MKDSECQKVCCDSVVKGRSLPVLPPYCLLAWAVHIRMAHLKDKQSGYSTGAKRYGCCEREKLICCLCLCFPFGANKGQHAGQDLAPAVLANVF